MLSVVFDYVRIRLCILVLLFSLNAVANGQTMNHETTLLQSESEILSYYRQPGIMTEPVEYSHLLRDIPLEIPRLCQTVQRVMLHIFWSEAYGVKLTEERKKEVNLRKFDRMLARISELDERPIHVPREPKMRVVGNCRDYSVFLSALLRYNGIAARSRCGFATYFTPGRYEDHWICEYWNSEEERWVGVDAQLDSIQVAYLKIDFDAHDLPPGKFLSGAETWQLCRRGELDPELCGIFDMKGLWFLQGNLVRDFMALNKFEVLPWDCNDIMGGPEVEVSEEDYQLLDKIAELITRGDAAFGDIREFYDSNDRLRMPADWNP
jgi:hypothetical protein